MSIACVVLTLNEEPRILDCLMQFRRYVDYILVVDGQSKDRTVQIAKTIADKVVVKPFSGSFAEERNYAWSLIPKIYNWILWADADEIWDRNFLINLHIKLKEAKTENVCCFRFPRLNISDFARFIHREPNSYNDWPDYQIRVVKNSGDFEWRNSTNEILWWKSGDIPLDQCDKESRERKLGISQNDMHPIVHLPRRKDLERKWW